MKMRRRICCIALAVLTVLILIMSTSCDDNGGYVCGGCPGPIEFPLEQNQTISWWYDYDNTYYTDDFAKLEDHPFMKEMEQRTNVTVTFVEPTSANPKAELELLMASSDMTDLVTHNGYVPFTWDKNLDDLIEQGIYYELTEYIDVQMDNFCSLRKQYAIIDKTIKTAKGNILYIPELNHLEDEGKAKQTEGLVLRKDLLDLVDCDIPATVEEWENVLREFKEAGVTNPLALKFNERSTFEQNVFLSAYGVKVGARIDPETGNVLCGATSDELYEYITLMNRWVSEGLLVTDAELTRENKLEEKTVGAWFSSADEITALNSSALSKDYELVGVADPVLYEGDKIELREKAYPVGTEEYDSVFISQTYLSPALACKWLDLFFTDEIYKRTSCGIEGEDYITNQNGRITFTEKITQNTNGVCYGIAQNTFREALYCDPNVMIEYGYSGNAKAAINEWSKSTSKLSILDYHAFHTEDERQMLHATLNGQYKIVSTVKNMILGIDPLESWEDYCEAVRDDIKQYRQVKQNVWDRYLAS